MGQEPNRAARRVFWIADNGAAHHVGRCDQRLRAQWPNLVVMHTPAHANWVNQVEIYFSVVQRKALIPNDFSCLAELEYRLLAFQHHYVQVAKPFDWWFTRAELRALLSRLSAHELLRMAVYEDIANKWIRGTEKNLSKG